jgi:hypothetical protein
MRLEGPETHKGRVHSNRGLGIQEVIPAEEEVCRPLHPREEPQVLLSSGNFNRILRHFEVIDEGSGRSPRMAFYQIADNEDNLRRWERKLCDEWRLVARIEEGNRVYCRKTELGENLHRILESHEYVGRLFEELIRDRLAPGNW